eukprot:GHVT01029441.1.p1 GENE.GHVT01029441.1~~GHVT01029441.1.p1  ORF type:complete len:247 (+),score=54.00 GHVT01029441.1:3805-4545(+)
MGKQRGFQPGGTNLNPIKRVLPSGPSLMEKVNRESRPTWDQLRKLIKRKEEKSSEALAKWENEHFQNELERFRESKRSAQEKEHLSSIAKEAAVGSPLAAVEESSKGGRHRSAKKKRHDSSERRKKRKKKSRRRSYNSTSSSDTSEDEQNDAGSPDERRRVDKSRGRKKRRTKARDRRSSSSSSSDDDRRDDHKKKQRRKQKETDITQETPVAQIRRGEQYQAASHSAHKLSNFFKGAADARDAHT